MAIAITDFEALCDFVPLEELAAAVSSVPELRDCIGDAPASALTSDDGSAGSWAKSSLKEAFSALMTCPPKKVPMLVSHSSSALDLLLSDNSQRS